MKQLTRLRSLANKNTRPQDDVEEQVISKKSGSTSQGITPRAPSGDVNNSGKLELPSPAPNKDLSTTKRSLFLQHGESEEDDRGCLEAVTRFLAAIAAAAADKDGKRPAEAPGASPALLQTSKGAGSIECRDSARELLRFFGHAPLLHLEGIIWVKTGGERGVCVMCRMYKDRIQLQRTIFSHWRTCTHGCTLLHHCHTYIEVQVSPSLGAREAWLAEHVT